ncbi:efflux RND transporter permease subunit, partial [candidate division KSB1 bacterium]|nr:efflux RND transporter permease subunit [candidate division KSB1 bacterium]
FNGLTLNQMSFGGLALGIGLIVDNAIVVLENMVRLRENRHSLEESALTGAKQVTGAIVASTLTTCVIFLPVVFMQTVSGMLFKELALVVVFSLLCSLLVAITLVPMVSSRFLTIREGEKATDDEGSRLGRFFLRLETGYSRWLEAAMRRKRLVFAVTAALLLITILLWPLLPLELAPQTDADEIGVELQLAQGMNIAVANEYLKELERIVREVTPMDQVRYMTTELRPGDAEVEISLLNANERTMNSFVLADHRCCGACSVPAAPRPCRWNCAATISRLPIVSRWTSSASWRACVRLKTCASAAAKAARNKT